MFPAPEIRDIRKGMVQLLKVCVVLQVFGGRNFKVRETLCAHDAVSREFPVSSGGPDYAL